jgi:hypothetical protein
MKVLKRALFGLVAGYVLSQIFKLSYSDSIYVALISGSIPLTIFLLNRFKNRKNGVLK